MTPLVTLEEARNHLRIDSDDDDPDLSLKVLAASAAVQNYLKKPWAIYEYEFDTNGDVIEDSDGRPLLALDSDGVPIPRYEVKAACLLMLGYLFKDRDNDERHEYETGYLPRPVTALLYALRDPAMAVGGSENCAWRRRYFPWLG